MKEWSFEINDKPNNSSWDKVISIEVKQDHTVYSYISSYNKPTTERKNIYEYIVRPYFILVFD